jgi:hypothetical protein
LVTEELHLSALGEQLYAGDAACAGKVRRKLQLQSVSWIGQWINVCITFPIRQEDDDKANISGIWSTPTV